MLTAGNVNDCTAATSLIDRMPASAKTVLADKGCDTDEIREALMKKKVEACMPSKANRTEPIPRDEKNANGVRDREDVGADQGLAGHRHAPRQMP